MKIVTIKSLLCFCVIVLLVLSFPIQVTLSSPVPSVFPYVGVALIFALTLVTSSGKRSGPVPSDNVPRMNLLVSIYLALVLFHTSWQTLLGFISVEEGITTVFVYGLPVTFFYYFRRVATEREIRAVLGAIALMGLVGGIYFAYDSYSKLVLGRVSDYALDAFNYTLLRGQMSAEGQNFSRIGAQYRSLGLLEAQPVSAAWVALGCFSALALVPHDKAFRRMIVISTYGLLLFIGLNFTSVVGFVLVIFLIEFQGMAMVRGVISKRGIKSMAIVVCGSLTVGATAFLWMGGDFFEVLQKILTFQVDLALGTTYVGDTEETYIGKLVTGLLDFPFDFPPGLLIGDGFSSFGRAKGGDIGVADTLHRFGAPFFLAIFLGLIGLIRRGLRQWRLANGSDTAAARSLWFAVCITIFLVFSEVHYTIWNAKSILPIFFLALGLYARYLMPHKRKAAAFVSPSVSIA